MEENKNSLNSRRDFIKSTATALAGFMIVPRFVLGGKRPDGSLYTAPSDVISLGFIGCGKQGRILSDFFLKTQEIRIGAISEVYKAKATLFQDIIKSKYQKNSAYGTFSEFPVYNDFTELLANKEVDAVVIATPDHWHAVMAVMAAEAGKDIYCEKPLSLTVKEGRAMVNAANKNKRVFQTGCMQRSWTEFRHAVELIRNGYIGEVKSIKVNVGGPRKPYDLTQQTIPDGLDWKLWLGPNKENSVFNEILAPPTSQDVYPRWRYYKEFGGGILADWGAHMFDIAQWALDMDNSGPTEIFAPNEKEYPFLTYKYENGITMTHQKWDWDNAVEFIGTEGNLRVARGKLETSPKNIKEIIIKDSDKRVYKSVDHYKDFLQAIRNRSNTICNAEVGHRTASICSIGNIAYELKRPLKWNPKSEKFKGDGEANELLGRPLNDKWKIRV